MTQNLRWLFFLPLLVALGFTSGGSQAGDAQAMRKRDDFVPCPSERAQMCTREFVPVCALRAGVEAFEQVTKGNRCDACADLAVEGYRPGDCVSSGPESPLFLDP